MEDPEEMVESLDQVRVKVRTIVNDHVEITTGFLDPALYIGFVLLVAGHNVKPGWQA